MKLPEHTGMAAQGLAVHRLIQHIRQDLQPKSVLEMSGADNALANPLRACGIPCDSVDVIAQDIGGRYELALCLGTLDRLAGPEIDVALEKLRSSVDSILVTAAFTDERPPAYWLRKFTDAGFAPAFEYSAEMLHPEPMLVRVSQNAADPASLPLYTKLLESRAALANLRERVEGEAAARKRLEDKLGEVTGMLAEVRDFESSEVEKLNGHIAQLQARTQQTHHEVQSILNSRIWKSLVSAAGLLLRLRGQGSPAPPPAASAPSAAPAVDAKDPSLRLCVDEPRRGDAKVVSGTIICRGWAIAKSGIEKVEVFAGTLAPAAARYGLYRPDIAKAFPGIADGERSGFQLNFDTGSLPTGSHTLHFRATSKAGATVEETIPLAVDHVSGYASDYYRWIAEFERRDTRLIEMKMAAFTAKPKISILVPVYRTAPEILEKTIGSVVRQSYSDWELCLADDRSLSPEIDAILAKHAAEDSRIRFVQLETNSGISAASNQALELASGEYIALLDHDDELAQDALFYMVDAINRHPAAGIFYSDEDHIDETGLRHDPFFKPDWSPDLILSMNYVTHLMVFPRALALRVGGFRSVCDISQDHDILLRMSRETAEVVHVPRVLYHWRTTNYTMNRASNQEQRVLASSLRAVEEHVNAVNPGAKVEPGLVPGRWRVRYPIAPPPLVSIVIPSARAELVERCLTSIAQETDYENYEIVVVDNSRNDGLHDYLSNWKTPAGRSAVHVDCRHKPFNFSALVNDGARKAQGSQLLFMNDDMSVITPGWLTAMVEHAVRPEVGAVGAKLLYPDDRIQHAGVTIGIFGVAGHGFKGFFSDQRHYFDFPDVIRNVSCVTGACLMTPARVFWGVGGFDTEAFPVAYNDVDLCLKILDGGHRVIYTPHAQLYHYEAFSKVGDDRDPKPKEFEAFKTKWKKYIDHDPFYSPNLTRTEEDYSLRKKPKIAKFG